eukprot:3480970-Rhodomonas_salina.2
MAYVSTRHCIASAQHDRHCTIARTLYRAQYPSTAAVCTGKRAPVWHRRRKARGGTGRWKRRLVQKVTDSVPDIV